MQNDVLLLHPVVVAAGDDLVVARQHGADRQAALRDARLGFGDGLGHEVEMILFNRHYQCSCCDRGTVSPKSVGRAISASNISRMRVSASSSVKALSLA